MPPAPPALLRFIGAILVGLTLLLDAGAAAALQETPSLVAEVATGRLPPIARRIPEEPLVVDLKAAGKAPGKPGGTLRMLISQGGDARFLVPFSYSRLVVYDEDYHLVPDILRSIDVTDGRIFTLHLRRGHRWSDGQPFTSEDFRYYWEDVANNPELSKNGLPPELLVNGSPPTVTFPDELTVRYEWPLPNQAFLPALAAASPLFIYRPAHYLKQFHIKYADPQKLQAMLQEGKLSSWANLHRRRDDMLLLSNPELPTLQPWIVTSHPLSARYEARRNPYYHRIDKAGYQLPYIDNLVLTPVPMAEIAARTAAGQSDLQAAGLKLDDLPLLRETEKQGALVVKLWPSGRGSQLALYPNLNAADPALRKLMRDVRFRRALSLAINRDEINNKVYGGQALPRANTVLRDSPLFNPDQQIAWSEFDPARAAELLNEIGLKIDDKEDIRRLPDGRRLSLVVATSSSDPTEIAVLQLIQQTWRKVGIELLIGAPAPDAFRKNLLSGQTAISIDEGLANGLATPAMSPYQLAPTRDEQNQWPRWGLYVETSGAQGEPIDMKAPAELSDLYAKWRDARSDDDKARIWQRMLAIHADQVFTIGIVGEVPQPVAASPRLKNLPDKDYYNWEPGAYFGIYRPDSFWLE